MRPHLLLAFSVLVCTLSIQSQSQPVKLANSDFRNAIEINDSVYGPTNVSLGYGDEMEITGENREITEANSAWFKFTAEYDTIITFDIIALDSADEYDFIVFKCSSSDCIKGIKAGKVKPDRVNFACNSTMVNYSNDANIKRSQFSTGLSKNSIETYLVGQCLTTYTSAISVKKGETWYLMVNNCYTPKAQTRFCRDFPKGFTIYFYNYWPKRRPVILENVLFETNKAILLNQSHSELNDLVRQMTFNKSMRIQISGHTDNKGSEADNQKLSEERAKAIKSYLVSKGVAESRISSIGMGSKQAIASNEDEAGRKKNRRVEFIIILK